MTSAQHFPESATLCLEGHLIDSLTLAKVIDTIQQLGGDYHLNHLSIGSRKNQLSSVILTLFAPDSEKLSKILEAITPYGAKALSVQDAILTAAQKNPPTPILPFSLPSHVRVNGEWIPVQSEGMEFVLAVNPQAKTAQLKTLKEVQPGEHLVEGFQGIQWTTPELQGTPPCKI